ncbi:adenylate/guanylate cyclase domain-containing protein [Leucobacter sp. CSA1]|uniref:Adenylate/guanylate cyclase domain-containing protein n=2 Tax=Micrococcales TaxID=85006 RepID=A0A934Q902_9MICO|nr:adenylate/guanylate cyclase domain-containing protein [Leucobacter chromiisoli]MCD1569892.1 adenylate/guanylate cyclase domain-containing protein [Agromyces mediolanus]
MANYTPSTFGDTVIRDFQARREGRNLSELYASAAPEAKALGHPAFEDLAVGERRTVPLAVAFLDLTDFTGRTFWDEETQVVDLAHAVLTGFIEVVLAYGGYPLGLRGDGLFAGFGPGNSQVDATMALGACAFALGAVESEVNPRLEYRSIHRVQARAGLDYGRITFVRTGSSGHSEVNPLGFAANFAAKCEKKANSWEIVVGEGLTSQLPGATSFVEHSDSPKTYQRDYERKKYHFYDYHWRQALPYLDDVALQLSGNPTSSIAIR